MLSLLSLLSLLSPFLCYFTVTRYTAQPVVWTPAIGTVQRSHWDPAVGLPVMKEPAAGGVADVRVEKATTSVRPSVEPPSNAAVPASGRKVVPNGTASVIPNVNAEVEE